VIDRDRQGTGSCRPDTRNDQKSIPRLPTRGFCRVLGRRTEEAFGRGVTKRHRQGRIQPWRAEKQTEQGATAKGGALAQEGTAWTVKRRPADFPPQCGTLSCSIKNPLKGPSVGRHWYLIKVKTRTIGFLPRTSAAYSFSLTFDPPTQRGAVLTPPDRKLRWWRNARAPQLSDRRSGWIFKHAFPRSVGVGSRRGPGPITQKTRMR